MLKRLASSVLVAVVLAACAAPAAAQPLTTHPRIWIRQQDLPRLRSWATSANPIYHDGLRVLAVDFKARMDNGSLLAGDQGRVYGYTQYPIEWFAQVFAFMSLVENDPAVRADYASRAHTLLMYIMNKAVLGPTPTDGDFRGRVFATDMRSLFFGDAFPTTVDWIYQTLTPAEKTTIRTVFLRWINENLTATTTGLDHPEPVWVLNSSALLSDSKRVKTSANNFYNAHMNQIGLMALSLDAADDTGALDSHGKGVRDYLDNAIGAWLYVHHQMMGTLEKGGVPPEGMAYGPTGLGRATEFMLALYTSGNADPAVRGQQVRMDTAFFDDVIAAYIHSSSPKKTIVHPDEAYKGTVHFVADHGDTYKLYYQGATTLLGTMGIQAQLSNNTARLNAIRWMETHMPPGGAAKLVERARDANYVRDCLLTFLLFDPAAAAPTDPRPSLPLSWFASGPGKILARTAWSDDASWFTYTLNWSGIDHQFGAANMFELWRKGEWLTKQWAGYGMIVAGSDYKNTMALENAPPNTSIDFWTSNYNHRSQWLYGPGGDPTLLAHSEQTDYVYAVGDATRSYNNPPATSTDIKEATRSILWVKPDTVIVYDRTESFTAGREKRFMLMLPAAPTFNGPRTTVATATQQLVVDTLLPASPVIGVDAQIPNGNGYNESAEYEKMTRRLKVDAPGGPAVARFLHVLQGADTGANVPASQLVSSTAGTPFQGAAVANVVAMFPVSLATAFTSLTYQVPAGVTVHYVTGLTPNARYMATVNGTTMSIVPSASGLLADPGGVLRYPAGYTGPPPTPTPVPGGAAALTVQTNTTTLAAGGTLAAAVTMTPGAITTPVDAYVVIQIPTGQYYSVQLGGGVVPGIVPIARGFVPFAYNGAIFQHTFPASYPPGTYTFMSALTVPGTLQLLTPIATTAVTFAP